MNKMNKMNIQNADPATAFHVDAYPDPDPLYHITQ